MTRSELITRFPKASEAFIRANTTDQDAPALPKRRSINAILSSEHAHTLTQPPKARKHAGNHNPVASPLPAQKPQPDKRKKLLDTSQAHEGGRGRIAVIITRCSTRSLDRDNNYSASKKIIDCLFKSGRIAGDTEADIELFVFQKKVKPANVGTLIELIPL